MSKVHAAIVVALLLAAVLTPSVASGQVTAAPPAKLTVTVLDGANYRAVVGANVSVTGPQNLSAATAADGSVVFRDIQAGNYWVTSIAPSYPMSNPQLVRVMGNTSVTILYGHTTAFFNYKPNPAIVNETIQFDASLSSSTGTITDYRWDFGDGTGASNKTATHTYTSTGDHLVSLTVTSTIGAATYTEKLKIPVDRPFNYAIILVIPLVLPFILVFLLLRRRRYYVVIQARIPPNRLHPHCPGNGDCDNCSVTPC